VSKRKVCLDTQIMIWGIKDQFTPNRKEIAEKAKHFVKKLNDENTKIVIPSVVLAEMMSNVPEDERSKVLNCFTKNFQIQPFDARTALIYADRYYKKYFDPLTGHETIMEGSRETIVADLMVVASAKAADVDVLYSEDSDVHKLSKEFIKASRIPDAMGQMDFFEE